MILENKEPIFERYMLSKADIRRIPIAGNFELLPICNMDCKMCYIKLDKVQVNNNGGLKSADEWLEVAKQARDEGMIFLLLTGGEVFLYKEFRYLYTELTKMGFVISINSNGTMIDEGVVSWLSEIPPRCINITLYGGSDETYKKLCNNPNGFSQVSKAIDLMLKNNICVKINACMTPYNESDLNEIYDFAKSRGLYIEMTSYSFPPIRKNKDMIGTGNRFTPESAAECKFNIKKLEYDNDELLHNSYNYIKAIESTVIDTNSYRGLKCRAGHSTFWITWDGKMTPCGMITKPFADPFRDGFSNAWNFIKREKDKIKLSKKCVNCKNKDVCTVCAASAVAETGKFDGTPSYICDMTRSYTKKIYKNLKEYSKDYENK